MASNRPFQLLGEHLKNVREDAKRSLEEVSGAIEIDESRLKQIEAGMERPSEDIMLLLINYFNIGDSDAYHLWRLGKYKSDISEFLDGAQDMDAFKDSSTHPMIMLLSMDVRTMYSDGIEISWNEAGFTLNFTQSMKNGDKKQSAVVARVGMSEVQAQNVLKTLEKALLRAKYANKKLLPPRTDS
ncbi:MAG TPA: helix-turn-helix transcriptional regulator [Candidatus Sulfotelmatobacter sp.]|nr:helix-turn-helix transcriptional regulator [Candidatus Sulfotelmatobacter sp.]